MKEYTGSITKGSVVFLLLVIILCSLASYFLINPLNNSQLASSQKNNLSVTDVVDNKDTANDVDVNTKNSVAAYPIKDTTIRSPIVPEMPTIPPGKSIVAEHH